MSIHTHCVIAISIAIALNASTTFLNEAMAQSTTVATKTQKEYTIPSGTLPEVLNLFATRSGIALSFNASELNDKPSNGLVGIYTMEQGFEKLLQSTNFIAQQISPNDYVLVRQIDATDRPMVLSAIKVQGELIERSVQDSQTSVAVITGETIEREASADISSFLQREAGVSFTNGITIRGINGAGAAGLGTGGLITTTIDGVRVSRVANQSSLENSTWDLEQIEILRGPQSTQNGLNSLAGTIVVNSNNPVHFQEGKVRIGAANGEKGEVAFAYNTPLVQDVLALRVSAELIRSNGFVDNPILGIGDVDSLDRELFRLGVLFEPSESWTSVLKLSYNDAEYGSNIVDSDAFPQSRSKSQLTEDTRMKTVFTLNWENTFYLNDSLRLETSTSHADFDIFTQFEGLFGGFLTVNGAREFDQELFDQEISLHYERDSGVRAVIGAFYSETDIKNRTFVVLAAPFTAPFDLPLGGLTIPAGFTAPAGTILADFPPVPTEQENYAVFGEIEIPITDSFSGIIGGRYDDSKFGTEESDAFVPKIGVVYQIDSQKSIGFTYQEGFREGGERSYVVTDLTSGTPVDRELVVPFDPQFSKNHEIAFRSEWLGGSLLVNANLFYTKWEDMQVRELVQSSDPNIIPQLGASVTTNAAESSLWGGEIDARKRVNERIELYSSIAYSNTEFDDFISFEDGIPLDLSGNQFRSAPEWSGNLGINYRFSEDWEFAADASYTGANYSEAENLSALENDAYWLVDVRLAKSFNNGLSITAYIDNLLDEDYTTNRSPVTDFVGVARDSVGLPLTYGVFAQFEF